MGVSYIISGNEGLDFCQMDFYSASTNRKQNSTGDMASLDLARDVPVPR
jgi:hypothetical protein